MPATEPARPMGGAADGNGMAPVGDVASLDTVVRSKKIPEVLFKNFRGKIFGNHIYTLSAACPADSFRTVVRSRPTGLTHRYPPLLGGDFCVTPPWIFRPARIRNSGMSSNCRSLRPRLRGRRASWRRSRTRFCARSRPPKRRIGRRSPNTVRARTKIRRPLHR